VQNKAATKGRLAALWGPGVQCQRQQNANTHRNVTAAGAGLRGARPTQPNPTQPSLSSPYRLGGGTWLQAWRGVREGGGFFQ
jgi:hypothetical protein